VHPQKFKTLADICGKCFLLKDKENNSLKNNLAILNKKGNRKWLPFGIER